MKGVVDEINVGAYGRDQWKLLDDFDWYGITVPEGFITDFASIPTAFRWYINPVGIIRPAALVHDYLYSKIGKVNKQEYTRKACDEIFLSIMERIKMKWFKRMSAYRAVRIGGWVGWNRRKKELEDESKSNP